MHDLRFALIRDAVEWEHYRQANSRLLPYILVQQYIRGTSASKFSVGIYANRKSEVKGIFVGRRVRGFPALYGDASLIESSWVPDSVLAEVADIVQRLGYAGIAEFEFNQDAENRSVPFAGDQPALLGLGRHHHGDPIEHSLDCLSGPGGLGSAL